MKQKIVAVLFVVALMVTMALTVAAGSSASSSGGGHDSLTRNYCMHASGDQSEAPRRSKRIKIQRPFSQPVDSCPPHLSVG